MGPDDRRVHAAQREHIVKKTLLAIVAGGIVCFALGFVIADARGGTAADRDHPPINVPVAATEVWFPPLDDYDTGGEPLDDERFEALMAALDNALTARPTLARFNREAPLHIWNFIRRFASPWITAEQREAVAASVAAFAEEHPERAEVVETNMAALERYAGPSEKVPTFSSKVSNYSYRSWFSADGEPFSDTQIDGILGSLDAMLELPETQADFEAESEHHFSLFANRLRRGRISDEQFARVDAYFDEVEANNPEIAGALAEHRFRVASFTPGRVAPNIVGKDTEGVEFALEDYRGNIVVLIFSGEWCGPCVGEYPFHHFIVEQFEGDPVVLLGINSDDDVETIRRAKASGKAPAYRTWWDGHSEVNTSGPIATAWGVTTWPTIYVLDEEGVIRSIGDRGGHLIAKVGDMLMEMRTREMDRSRTVESVPAMRTVPARRANE